MNKYLKKFGIISAMLSTIIGVGVIQNGITANAATIGQQLKTPEDGWKRYDDSDKNIAYSSSFRNAIGNPNFYNSTFHMVTSWTTGPHNIKFSFYGTKFRLISRFSSDYVKNAKISFDGGETFDNLSEYITDGVSLIQVLVYEKTGLEKNFHDVDIEIPSTTYVNGGTNYLFLIDAIDIDQDGYLAPYSDPIKSESISLNKSSLDLSVGNSEQLTATTTPAAVGVTWKSSDESVATVDSNGKVTGIKAGQATVTATTADGSNLSSSCTVNVKDVSPTVVSLSVTPEEAKLMPGEQKQLQVIATMSDGSTKDVTSGNGATYTSSRPTIGTVDENGLVTIFQDAPLDHGTSIYVTYGGITVFSDIWTGTDTTN
ncbi:Ig-like domain-containing protein [uncultured Clostridium sp.]|uniref:Ig-like domain-containing protein n=1 Tax=uncultured Clostridium sp. TaxID=59620 RepID=UPI0028EFD914|nr:Ig-like domain-containing protein [uncultured Clostridium sp.]